MLSAPGDLDERALADALERGWGIGVAAMVYRPVGWGSHHWEVADGAGARWFVTVDELELKRLTEAESRDDGFARLTASLRPAVALRDAGLDVAAARALPSRNVLTHGEPHPGNTMLTADGWRLIDWDTVLVAPPERDLWDLDPGDGSVLDAYAAATGVTPLPGLLDLYRLGGRSGTWPTTPPGCCARTREP